MSKILIPINNNNSRETTPLNLPNGIATIYAFVNADRNLTVEVFQSFDSNLTYDKIETKEYLASNGGTAFYFNKIGSDAVLKLTNNSGQDCTFTRAFLDYTDSSISSDGDLSNVSDATTHTELQSLGLQVTSVNDDLKQSIQQSFNKYNFYGRNNEVALNAGGELIYADSVPPPIRSPDYREGWLYVNDNAGNKFNYYYFSNTAFLVPADDILGQFCVFENLVPTTENVNVLLAIYAGADFFTGPRRVYTSNVRIKPGVKYLAYWGQDPGVFPALPRLEYTLASERNWNGDLNVLTMSVGSDSGYAAQTVGNLMTHVGYVDSEGAVTSSLIGSTDNINSGAQILKTAKESSDILASTGNAVGQIRDRLDSGNAFQTNDAVAISALGDLLGSSDSILSFLQLATLKVQDSDVRNQLETANNTLVLLGQKLDQVNTNLVTLINQGGGGGGGGDVELRSIIPDTDPDGVPIVVGEGEQIYTWEFTTGVATQYDLYAQTNSVVVMDEERIIKMYLSSDSNETTILDPTMFFSKNQNQITMTLPEGESYYVINFTDSTTGATPQAEITLNQNTSYRFKVITQFNDNDETSADIRFAITPIGETTHLNLNYISVVSGGGGNGGV